MKAKFRTAKAQFLLEYCRGRRVLDVGCVNHDISFTRKPDWRHGQLRKVATHLVGLDYARGAVSQLRQEGWEIHWGDAQNFDLTGQYPEKFDVVLAADLIEHLPNPGAFLVCARKHLTPGGVVLLTTPHAYGFGFFLQVLLFGEERINDTHTLTFSRKNMQVMMRYSGLREREFHWLIEDSSRWAEQVTERVLKKGYFWCQCVAAFLTRAAFAKEMIIFAEPVEDHAPQSEPFRLEVDQ